MLRLLPPERTTEQLRAIAASGSSGLSAKAQADLQARKHAEIRAEIRAELAKRGGR